MSMTSLQDVKDAVEQNGNVLSVKVETLRLAYGAGKMGKHVASSISAELAGLGINHSPDTLPIYSHEKVRLFKSGSRVAEIIAAVMALEDEDDELLREVATGEDAAVVRRIRELVCS